MSTGVLASSSSPFVSDEFGPSARTVEQLRAQFQSADTNADGRLDQDEIVAIMTQNGIDPAAASKHAATLFRITNANTTNEDDATKQQLGMTYAEFVQEFVRLARFQSIKAIQARFNEIDTDGDGILSHAELRASLVRQVGEDAASSRVDTVFAEMTSLARDGLIDVKSFWQYLRDKAASE